MKIYNIYDVIAEKFAPPFFQSTDKMAVRTVMKSIEEIGRPTDEFELFKIGVYDEMLGFIADCEKIKVDLI